MTHADAPSVTILLLCHKDERFIRASLEAAFAQTVPCEIIVSNDCSGDRTFDIAQEMVAQYHGHHRVSVRRNERNLGVAEHVNATVPLASGEIIVMMAGDDIAYPHRVAATLDAFARNPRVTILGSDFDGIDEEGRAHPLRFRPRPDPFGLDAFVQAGRLIGLLGATIAFRREVFDRFGPILGPIEDNALSLRGALLGQCLQLQDKLIQYRQHAGSVSAGVFARNESQDVAMRRRYERTIRFYRGTADDLEQCATQLPDLAGEGRRHVDDILAMYRIEADSREALLERPRLHWVRPILRGLMQRGARRKSAERALKLFVPRRWIGLRA
ncbi:glycosyltransferase [Lysobacter sp. A6]|uniref:Glycosyltransferase n=1 Tax=Noviluteimonas lactosilytica TaxID=2888523 RepID=A0ABS8JKW6_9GAMM|nr:glycosyltransferase [Lysobacter lactosilyticus]